MHLQDFITLHNFIYNIKFKPNFNVNFFFFFIQLWWVKRNILNRYIKQISLIHFFSLNQNRKLQMGNSIQCSLIQIDRGQQLSSKDWLDANIEISTDDWEVELGKKIEKFEMLNKMDTNSLGFQKLAQARRELNKFDTIMFEHDSIGQNMEGIGSNQDVQIKYINEQATTKIRDYICFKKYSPKVYYNFIKMIHSSKSSKIYQVAHINNNSLKVIKIIKPKQSVSIKKFANFMSVLNKLDHPNIIRFYQVYQYKGNQYLVMQIMQGGSLKDIPSLRRQHKVSGITPQNYFEQMKVIVKQILYALRYLHDNKIGHLNIHAKNILLANKFGSKKQVFAKLVGFGSSLINLTNQLKIVDHQLFVNKSETNQLLPPELLSTQSVCLKTDIWMLGIAIFEAITKVKINKGFIKQCENDKRKLPKYLQSVWKKLQQELNFRQSHLLDLIIRMISYKPSFRPSAFECLEHPWFVSLDFDSISNNCKLSSNRALRKTTEQKKSNNLISFIENLIVYKNITKSEMVTVSEIFSILDKDKNGAVQIQELIEYFQSESNQAQGPNIFQFCLQLVSNLDKDGSGTIDYHQFSKAVINKRTHITRQAIQEIFDHIDTDGNGIIVLSELKTILGNCNLDQLQYYIRTIDENYDQTINKAEFINYCLMKFEQKWTEDPKSLNLQNL